MKNKEVIMRDARGIRSIASTPRPAALFREGGVPPSSLEGEGGTSSWSGQGTPFREWVGRDMGPGTRVSLGKDLRNTGGNKKQNLSHSANGWASKRQFWWFAPTTKYFDVGCWKPSWPHGLSKGDFSKRVSKSTRWMSLVSVRTCFGVVTVNQWVYFETKSKLHECRILSDSNH